MSASDVQLVPVLPVGAVQLVPVLPAGDAQVVPVLSAGDVQLVPVLPAGDVQLVPVPPLGDVYRREVRPKRFHLPAPPTANQLKHQGKSRLRPTIHPKIVKNVRRFLEHFCARTNYPMIQDQIYQYISQNFQNQRSKVIFPKLN